MRRAQLLFLLFVLPHCAHVQRDDLTWVEVDGHWVVAQDTRHGCEGETLDRTEHRQLGGTVALEHRAASGFAGGARASLGSGVITSSTLPEADRSHYLLGSIGAWVGYDFRYWGVEGGLNFIFSDGALEDDIALPWIRVRGGPDHGAWFEASLGPRDGVFDGRFMALGAGFREGLFSGRAGFALLGRPIADAAGDVSLATDEEGLDPGAYVEASFALSPSFSLGFGAQLSVAPSGWLALRFGLPTWGDEVAP
ncbi:MAG: hypothetical protein KC635_01335 [Myxococcales bacterium]|nr:hypothetical protein [Myxococcales bacterium]MCB9737195.1 hypothetical protein [Deltaproteobacteria bacterium]